MPIRSVLAAGNFRSATQPLPVALPGRQTPSRSVDALAFEASTHDLRLLARDLTAPAAHASLHEGELPPVCEWWAMPCRSHVHKLLLLAVCGQILWCSVR